MDTSDFAKRLADKLIEQLKAGTAPWQQPWAEGQSFSPYNPTTGNRYRGINVLALLGTAFRDPRWMTYKQALAQGWQVRAGEKGTQIQHWIWEEARVRVGQDGQPVLDSQKKLIKDLVRLERPKVITAAVFNAEQIDEIPALEPERTYDWDPVEQAEKLLQASWAKIEHSQSGGAYYRLSTDRGCKPKPPKIPSRQIESRHDRVKINEFSVATKSVVAIQMDVSPRRRRDFGNYGQGFRILVCLVPGKQPRQDSGVVM
jgi:putative DNA primase/helicase